LPSLSVTKGISNRQSQNRYVAAVIHDSSASTIIKTAKDIQLLLNNIGAASRASMNQIEFLMNEASNKNGRHVTASDVIDLIARVRSV
jgi:hypothetical protein